MLIEGPDGVMTNGWNFGRFTADGGPHWDPLNMKDFQYLRKSIWEVPKSPVERDWTNEY